MIAKGTFPRILLLLALLMAAAFVLVRFLPYSWAIIAAGAIGGGVGGAISGLKLGRQAAAVLGASGAFGGALGGGLVAWIWF